MKYSFSNIKMKGGRVFPVLLLALALNSCDRSLDINTDPDVLSTVPASGILPAAEVSLAYTLGGDASRMPASIVQYYAGHRGQPLDYARYDIEPAATDNLWTNLYQIAYNLRQAENSSIEKGHLVTAGIAQLLQAETFSVATDMFGDIPFSQALNGPLNITPKYDKQQDVYESLLALIDKGIANVKSNAGVNPGNADVIFAGNRTKWEKFGNSLKLRILNHLSKIDPSRALNFLNTNPSLILANADNAKYVFSKTPTGANPIFQFDELSGRKDQAVASTFVNKLKALSDPRVPLYFKGVVNGALAGQIIGNTPGSDDDDSGETKFSRIGSAYGSTDSPVYLMTAAEVNFIKAEIYLRAGNNADAKTAYEEAIKQDFSSLGLSSASAAYIAKPEVAFDNTLARLIEQKWITMYQAPYESFVDWRRTGFPVLTESTQNLTNNIIPRRLPYCQKEINVNGASLSAGPGIPKPLVDLKNRVWWDKL